MKFLLLSLLLNPAFAEFKIALIDSGVNRNATNIKICDDSKDFAKRDDSIDDTQHGTVMASIISEGLEDYCIMDLRIFRGSFAESAAVEKALDYAIEHGASIVNASIQGSGKSIKEEKIFKKASSRGIYVITAAGNFGVNLSSTCNCFPACYNTKKMIVVEDSCSKSNYGGPVKFKVCSNYVYKNLMWQGSSVSTARVTNTVVRGAMQLRKKHEEEKRKGNAK